MPERPLVNQLADGRLQLRHGPIDLLIEAFGTQREVELAYQQAAAAFTTVLTDLVDELTWLRMRAGSTPVVFKGPVAQRMGGVAKQFADAHFVTPMIAVAGAVADQILHDMTAGRQLTKAYVNNGGDIAMHLTAGQCFTVGVCANPLDGSIVSRANIAQHSDIRGIATSGWRGRSHSLGIADSITVLAASAAMADAAATLIANAVDLPGHPMINRKAANTLSPDSDLGDRLVTVDVGRLDAGESRKALAAGQRLARSLIDAGKITAVYGRLNAAMFALQPHSADQANVASGLVADGLEPALNRA